MTHPSQQQQPRSHNGQYATTPRAESQVSLALSDQEYNAEGTFAFPPIARSYEQAVDFWMRVPVPDRVLHQLQVEYHEAQVASRSAAIHAEPEPERMRHGRETPQWQEWFERANAIEVRMLQEHPDSISPVLARPIARATMLLRQAQTFEDVEPGVVERVRQTPMDLSVLGNPTVGALIDLYPTLDLPEQTWVDQSTEYAAVAADKLEELIEWFARGDGGPN